MVPYNSFRSHVENVRESLLKKNQNAHPPVRGKKMSKCLGGIKGCKYKTSFCCFCLHIKNHLRFLTLQGKETNSVVTS